MDYFKKYTDQVSLRIYGGLVIFGGLLTIAYYFGKNVLQVNDTLLLIVLIVLGLILAVAVTLIVSKSVTSTMMSIQQILQYKYQPQNNLNEPDITQLRVGKTLVENFWNLLKSDPTGTTANTTASGSSAMTAAGDSTILGFVCDNSPLPIVAVDKDQRIKYINPAFLQYFEIKESPLDKALFDVTNILFSTEDTYESWYNDSSQNSVRDSHLWYRVKAKIGEQALIKHFDLAASYQKDSPTNIASIITLYDQTDHYSQDDRDVGFLALAVHELRTPLTIMRGYIEVLEDEVAPQLGEEMMSFMNKLNASAQQLTAFVSNILNMARVEENQLTFSLREENWQHILETAINDLKLRAQVHGKTLQLTIDPGLPPVAVDRTGIHEVINNLVENAVKYSGESNQILIRSGLNSEGVIETSIQDFGVGIPASILPHLFEKFYRSHRTRGTASGTGLGLYLCKAVIKAHGGMISAESHEGKGSTFKFTLLPFSQVAAEQQNNGQDGIIRGAHGWIKNHNIYKQ